MDTRDIMRSLATGRALAARPVAVSPADKFNVLRVSGEPAGPSGPPEWFVKTVGPALIKAQEQDRKGRQTVVRRVVDDEGLPDQIEAVGPGVTPEQVALALGRLESVKRQVKEAEALLWERLEEAVRAGGPLVVGDKRYCIGERTETVYDDAEAVLVALFDAAAGDFGAVAACIASRGIKHGAAMSQLTEGVTRKLVGPEVLGLFRKVRKEEVQEGKAPKRTTLLEVDLTFSRGACVKRSRGSGDKGT